MEKRNVVFVFDAGNECERNESNPGVTFFFKLFQSFFRRHVIAFAFRFGNVFDNDVAGKCRDNFCAGMRGGNVFNRRVDCLFA